MKNHKKKSFIHFPLQDCIPVRSLASQLLFRSSSSSSLHDFTSFLTDLKVREEKDVTSLLLPFFCLWTQVFFPSSSTICLNLFSVIGVKETWHAIDWGHYYYPHLSIAIWDQPLGVPYFLAQHFCTCDVQVACWYSVQIVKWWPQHPTVDVNANKNILTWKKSSREKNVFYMVKGIVCSDLHWQSTHQLCRFPAIWAYIIGNHISVNSIYLRLKSYEA